MYGIRIYVWLKFVANEGTKFASALWIACWCLYRDSRISGESAKLNLLPQGLVLPLYEKTSWCIEMIPLEYDVPKKLCLFDDYYNSNDIDL